MAKRKTTLKKKVSKRQTRKFSNKGGSKKGGSKKGGSKKGGSKKGGSKKGGAPTSQKFQADLRDYKAKELGILNEHKADAKARGIKIEMMDEMKDMQTNIPLDTGGPVNAKDRRNASQIIRKAEDSLTARFNSKGIMNTPINNNNINELIAYGNEYGFTKSLKLLFEKSKEKGLELSKDNQELANKYLEEEPPLPSQEQHEDSTFEEGANMNESFEEEADMNESPEQP